MIKQGWAALAATLYCIVSPSHAASPSEGQAAAERLLGSDGGEAQWQSYLPFTRKLNAWGVVVGSLAISTEAAGVPPAAMIEALHALAAAIDPERDVKAGDLFWVRYEQEYTVDGDPVGTGRVLWAELRTAAKGTVAIHRFRAGKTNAEPFWLATGQSTGMTSVRLPLERISISSGFGLRADPIDQPASRAWAMGPVRVTPATKQKARASNTLGKGNSTVDAEARAMMTRAGAVPPRPTSKLDDRRFERVTITGASGLTNPALAKPSFPNQATGASDVNVSPSRGLSISLSPVPPSEAPGATSQGTAARAVAPRRGPCHAPGHRSRGRPRNACPCRGRWRRDRRGAEWRLRQLDRDRARREALDRLRPSFGVRSRSRAGSTCAEGRPDRFRRQHRTLDGRRICTSNC